MSGVAIVDICNMALSDCAARATITDLNDGSPAANACKLWYDRMRRSLLRTAHWGFARTQNSMSQIGDLVPDNTSPYPWLWQYLYPADCIRFRYILAPPIVLPANVTSPPQTGIAIPGPTFMTPSRNNRWLLTQGVDGDGNPVRSLVSNIQAAIGVYTRDETNTELFDDLFVLALESALSYKICNSVAGNVKLREGLRQNAVVAIADARAADGNEAIASTDNIPDWILTRGTGSPFGWNPALNTAGQGGEWGNWYGGYDQMSWGE